MFVTTENGNTTLHGPFQHHGSNTFSQTISPGLEADSKYSLWVDVELITGTVTSDEHVFGKRVCTRHFMIL